MVVPRRQLGVTVASAGLTASCKVFQLVAGEKQFTGLFFLLPFFLLISTLAPRVQTSLMPEGINFI